ncbi:MAG: hypothetical protein EXR73_05330 [Myxococcales bacterium]|nr:hypothetical protein [Myxococcales bacterium]
MLAKLFLQYLLAVTFGVGVDEGFATLYGTPGDIWAGGDMACFHRPVPQDEPLCAHRWLPCGTRVSVTNLERSASTTCVVADRGPFGIDRDSGRWRGILDLTPFAAKKARLDGRDFVRLIYRLPDPGHKTYRETRFLRADRNRAFGPIM